MEKQLIIKKENINKESTDTLKTPVPVELERFREIASLQQKSYKFFNLDDL